MAVEPNEIDILNDEFTNCLVEKETGNEVKTEVRKVEILKPVQYKDWNFNWAKEFKNGREVFSLHILESTDIQGLLALSLDKKNQAVEVSLVEAAPHNIGKKQKYSGVGPHLFAFASLLSFREGFEGYVIFKAKTNLIKHYQITLGAYQIGNSQQMIIHPQNSQILVQKYFPDQQREWFKCQVPKS